MPTASGTALIQHRITGTVYSVESSELDWVTEGSGEERGMGVELFHTAVVDHPELGELAWELWEYPIGVEDGRQTNIGGHTLIRNLSFGLSPAGEDEEDEDALDSEKNSRVEHLVEWFFERYEDPAHSLPYISAEGGYQWIWGGPYNAADVLSGEFPTEDEAILRAAVEEIESDGTSDWTLVNGGADDHYADENFQAEVEEDYWLALPPEAVAKSLAELLRTVPASTIYPNFVLAANGQIDIAYPGLGGALQDPADELLAELVDAARALVESLAGTNAHVDLAESSDRYFAAITANPTSIRLTYCRGVRLETVAFIAEAEVQSEERPPLPSPAAQALQDVLQLNAAYVMSHQEGRELAENAAAYQRPSADLNELRRVAQQMSTAISQAPQLFTYEAQRAVDDAVATIGLGRSPDRSTQVGVGVITNLLVQVIKGVALVLVGQIAVASVPGAAAVDAGTLLVNDAFGFLAAHTQVIQALTAIGGPDSTWVSQSTHLLMRIRQSRRG